MYFWVEINNKNGKKLINKNQGWSRIIQRIIGKIASFSIKIAIKIKITNKTISNVFRNGKPTIGIHQA